MSDHRPHKFQLLIQLESNNVKKEHRLAALSQLKSYEDLVIELDTFCSKHSEPSWIRSVKHVVFSSTYQSDIAEFNDRIDTLLQDLRGICGDFSEIPTQDEEKDKRKTIVDIQFKEANTSGPIPSTESKKANSNIVEKFVKNLEQQAGDYVIDFNYLIGKGNFGKVYKGRVRGGVDGDTEVAAKVIETDNFKSIEDEVIVMAVLKDNPHILQCYGYSHIAGTERYFIYTELAEYGSLWATVGQEKRNSIPIIPLSLSIRWIYGLISAVQAMHDNRIVHKDIKCQNLLLFSNLDVRLCDFGLSKQLKVGHDATKGEGVMGFTPGFVAPEVENKSGHSTFASDMYSVGITILQIMHRKNGGFIAECREKYCSDHIKELKGQIRDSLVLGSFGFALSSCLKSDPEERCLAHELAAAVEALLKVVPSVDDLAVVNEFASQLKPAPAIVEKKPVIAVGSEKHLSTSIENDETSELSIHFRRIPGWTTSYCDILATKLVDNNIGTVDSLKTKILKKHDFIKKYVDDSDDEDKIKKVTLIVIVKMTLTFC